MFDSGLFILYHKLGYVLGTFRKCFECGQTVAFHLLEQKHLIYANGRRPQFLRQMEDDLNFLVKWKMTSFSRQMEDNIFFLVKWKTTSIFRQMEDNLNS
jgi:hypothetical protein